MYWRAVSPQSSYCATARVLAPSKPLIFPCACAYMCSLCQVKSKRDLWKQKKKGDVQTREHLGFSDFQNNWKAKKMCGGLSGKDEKTER